MDRLYRNQRRFYDLTRKYYLFGRDRLIRELDLRPGETLAEIGCGTARNLIVIARRYPGTTLYGLDASSEMLKTAQAAVAKAELSDRIKFAQGYAEAFRPAQVGIHKPLNIIVFSYSLSMIPNWRAALAAAGAALAPRGRVHVVDFGDLAGLPRPVARLLHAWLSQFHVAPREILLQEAEVGADLPGRKLALLPGRYAFLLSASGDDPILAPP